MTGAHGSGEALIVAVAAVAAAGWTALVLRRLGSARSRSRDGLSLPAGLPAWLRAALWAATPVVPMAAPLRRLAWLVRLEQRLQGLGLDAISGARWVGAAGVAAACGGLLFGAAALAAGLAAAWPALPGAVWGGVTVLRWPALRHRERDAEILRTLPSWLDLLTICVEAGSTLTNGLRLAVDQAPAGPLSDFFARVLREIRSGRSRVEAFRHAADVAGSPSLVALATALIHAESSGMSLGEVLREQARQRGVERFTRAERLAMQAPVRLLAPLVLFIFPCTFIVIALPIIARVLEVSR
jgi:tight adherence protein C